MVGQYYYYFFFLRFRIDPMIDGGGGIDGDADLVFSLSLSLSLHFSFIFIDLRFVVFFVLFDFCSFGLWFCVD